MMEFHGREISLAELGAMAATSEFAINIIKKEWVSSYEEFVESVYDSIDKAFALLEKVPNHTLMTQSVKIRSPKSLPIC
ncbi:hypothetical protein [Janthinobacterium lividum]|uniref:hypothetical protein n=1 Tax=Janthinobacterium lividum TaxID=29581 RepID=UPI000FE199E2|nr:hypothetical protein [Janthinobacterium lividum]